MWNDVYVYIYIYTHIWVCIIVVVHGMYNYFQDTLGATLIIPVFAIKGIYVNT